MQAFPPIPPLEPRHVKELVRQIRALRYDRPTLSPDELAEAWADTQRWRIHEHRPTPFADFLASDGWERGFARAAELATRVDEVKSRQRELRQKAKAWKKAHPKPRR